MTNTKKGGCCDDGDASRRLEGTVRIGRGSHSPKYAVQSLQNWWGKSPGV